MSAEARARWAEAWADQVFRRRALEDQLLAMLEGAKGKQAEAVIALLEKLIAARHK